MSLLKAIKAQLGLSNTPANNFTITAEADNGTLKLARGNAGATTQDILTVDASGKVTFPQNAQSWQDVKASRALSTSYTNSTGQPIKVAVSGVNTSAFILYAVIGGVTIQQSGQPNVGYNCGVYFDVPAGASYQVFSSGGTATIQYWAELR